MPPSTRTRLLANPAARLATALTALLAIALAATLGLSADPASAAATGQVTEFKITVTDDGTQPAALDGSNGNGLVAAGSQLVMSWSISAQDLVDGTFTQTLPAGWSWQTSSLTALTSSSSVYTASYTVDGPTLKATMSIPNSSIVNIPGLIAVPSSSVTNGSTYTPSVTYSDGNGPATATTSAVTVVGQYAVNVNIIASGGASAGTFDFGAGPVPAFCAQEQVTVSTDSSVGTIFGIPDPVTANVKLTGLAPAAVTAGGCSVTPPATSSGIVTVDSYDSASGTLGLHIDGASLTPSGQLTGFVTFWYPATQVTETAQQTALSGTVAPVTVGGKPSFGAGSVGGTVTVASSSTKPTDPVYTPATSTSSTFAWSGGAGTSPAYNAALKNWATASVGTSAGTIAKDATDLAFSQLNLPHLTTGSFATQPVTDLVAYDFWDPSLTQLVEGTDSVHLTDTVNGITTVLDPSTYTVEYTNGTDTSGPWVSTVAEAGGAAAVTGVKVSLTQPPTYTRSDVLQLAVMQQVVGDYGQSVVNNVTWNADEFTAPVSSSTAAVIKAASLTATMSATPSAIVSGSPITYTLTETACAPAGSTTSMTRDLTVTATLASVVTSADTSDAIAAGWTVSSYTPADLGPDGMPGTDDDVKGPVITFTLPGVTVPVSGCATVPSFTLPVTTSLKAPAHSTLIRASSAVTAPDMGTASASATVNVTQSNTLSLDGAVSVPVIQPGDTTAEWSTDWYNFTSSDVTGGAYILEVLPHDRDGRGTSTTASLSLAAATLEGQAVSNGAVLQYTTTDPAKIGPVPGDGATWQEVDASTDLSTATALRVYLPTLSTGAYGGLRVTMTVSGQSGGDRLVNDAQGSFVTNSTTLSSASYAVKVVAASLHGTVFDDADGDGAQDGGEQGIVGATVKLSQAGSVVATATTDSAGAYTFANLDAGTYTVSVDPSTLGGGTVVQTSGPHAALDDASGALGVAQGQSISGLDFGYQVTEPAPSPSPSDPAPSPSPSDPAPSPSDPAPPTAGPTKPTKPTGPTTPPKPTKRPKTHSPQRHTHITTGRNESVPAVSTVSDHSGSHDGAGLLALGVLGSIVATTAVTIAGRRRRRQRS